MKRTEEKRRQIRELAGDLPVLAVLALYLYLYMRGNTTIKVWWPACFSDRHMTLYAAIAAALRFALVPRVRRMRKEWLMAVAAAAAFFAVALLCGYEELMVYPLFMMGTIGMPLHRVLYVFCAVTGAERFAALIGALGGSIEDHVYIRSTGVRHCLGILFPTDCAAGIVYLLLMISVAFPWISDSVLAVLYLAASALVWFVCDGRTSAAVLLLGALVLVMRHAVQAVQIWYRRRHGGKPFAKSGGRRFNGWAFPLCAALSLGISVFYSEDGLLARFLASSSFYRTLAKRFELAHAAYQTYGIRLFGSSFEMIGTSLINNGENEGYNFIDSSYCLILIRYGLVLFLVLMGLWLRQKRRAHQTGNHRLSLAMSLIAIHCILEHRYIDPLMNILSLLPFADYGETEVKGDRRETTGAGNRSVCDISRRDRWIRNGVLTGAIGLSILAVRLVLPGLRTLITVKGYYEPYNQWEVEWMAIIVLTAMILFFHSMSGAIRKKDKLKQRLMYGIGSIVVLITVGVWVARQIESYEYEYTEKLTENQSVIATLTDMEKDPHQKAIRLIADTLPLYYEKWFGDCFAFSWFSGEAVVDSELYALITRADRDCSVLLEQGAEKIKLPDGEILYTNSESIAEAVRQTSRQDR